jgi:MoxR-like ATPase
MSAVTSSSRVHAALEQLDKIILGKSGQVRLALACLLAKGHLLIEDVPGVGKTTLAQALSITLGLEFRRTQFTSDLLPADLLGVSIFSKDEGNFRFLPGPIFAQVLLADEINRATPKTQSALLEAMEEGQVTVEGVSHPLPRPFFVIATQNPSYQLGTYPLPESQLDRFLMTLSLGYPSERAERELLLGQDRRELLRGLKAILEPDSLEQAQVEVSSVHASSALIDYVQALLRATRESSHFSAGLSPRAALSLLAASRAWAWLEGRSSLLPDDVQAVFLAVVTHRLTSRSSGGPDAAAVKVLLEGTRIP